MIVAARACLAGRKPCEALSACQRRGELILKQGVAPLVLSGAHGSNEQGGCCDVRPSQGPEGAIRGVVKTGAKRARSARGPSVMLGQSCPRIPWYPTLRCATRRSAPDRGPKGADQVYGLTDDRMAS